MLRVIIADDEERICKLIAALADWPRLDMEVVGVGSNGLEALDLIARFSPDILITDIRMPGCDGLELISRAKKSAPFLEVIIISGYAQFDYAQTAIQYGVGEYLLKPINRQALNSTLERMAARCRERRQAQVPFQDSRDGRERLRARLLPDLLDGRYTAGDAARLAERYCFQGQGDTHQVFLLKMDYDNEHFEEDSLEIVKNRAQDVLISLMTPLCADMTVCFRDAALYGVICYANASREAVRARLREGLNQLVALCGLLGPVVFSMALGQPIQTAEALPESLHSAQRAILERLTEGTGRLLEGSAPPSGFLEAQALARYAKEIDQAVDILSADEAQAAGVQLEEAARAVNDIRGGELFQLVRDAGVLFVTRLGTDNREQVLAGFLNRCDCCATPQELFAALQKLQHDLLNAALEKRQNQAGQPVRLAKQYIQKNFATPLTLEEVSEAIGLSVNYFSTLFKRETGEGFMKYLTRVRMEEARSLLRDTRLPVAQIIPRVGYTDVKHFTHTFKAATGLTPGEFRKLYG